MKTNTNPSIVLIQKVLSPKENKNLLSDGVLATNSAQNAAQSPSAAPTIPLI